VPAKKRLNANLAGAIGCAVVLAGVPQARAARGGAARGVRIQRDVPYGPLAEETLDICSPAAGISGRVPAFVVIHGGGWRAGDKRGRLAEGVCRLVASRGCVGFNVDYRLVRNDATVFPNRDAIGVFPASLVDAQLAVRWIRSNAARYGVDATHVCAWGDSSGAFLALMLGVLDNAYPGDEDRRHADESSAANCVIDNSGPSDLTKALTEPANSDGWLHVEQFVNSRSSGALRAASPVFYVRRGGAPVIITQGTRDATVPPYMATIMRDALKSAGVPVSAIWYDGGHVFKGLSRRQKSAIIRGTIDWALAHYSPSRTKRGAGGVRSAPLEVRSASGYTGKTLPQRPP
jgi:acetyl esterase/lipase